MQDDAGEPVTLHLPCVLASSLILTLPRLMTRCLQLLGGTEARLVFPMNAWTLEAGAGTGEVILTLRICGRFCALGGRCKRPGRVAERLRRRGSPQSRDRDFELAGGLQWAACGGSLTTRAS